VAEKFARSAFDSDESDESLPHPHQPRHTRNAQFKKINSVLYVYLHFNLRIQYILL
jgi:hypothetical protein